MKYYIKQLFWDFFVYYYISEHDWVLEKGQGVTEEVLGSQDVQILKEGTEVLEYVRGVIKKVQ